MLVRRRSLVVVDEGASRPEAFGNGIDEMTAAPSKKYSSMQPPRVPSDRNLSSACWPFYRRREAMLFGITE